MPVLTLKAIRYRPTDPKLKNYKLPIFTGVSSIYDIMYKPFIKLFVIPWFMNGINPPSMKWSLNISWCRNVYNIVRTPTNNKNTFPAFTDTFIRQHRAVHTNTNHFYHQYPFSLENHRKVWKVYSIMMFKSLLANGYCKCVMFLRLLFLHALLGCISLIE